MNSRKTIVLLFLALILASAFTIHFTKVNASMTQPITINTPSYDGHIFYNGSYYREDSYQYVWIQDLGGGDAYRAYLKFNTSNVPNNASVSRVDLNIYVSIGVDEKAIVRSMENDPESASDSVTFADCADGDVYFNFTDLDVGWYNVTLSPDAPTDLENLLGSDYFAIGFEEASTDALNIRSMEDSGGHYPQIVVYYTNTNYNYTLHGLYGENATGYIPVTVTASAEDGTNSFEVNGTRIVGFDRRQTVFFFDVDAGDQRGLYPVADTETFYLFRPGGAYDTYEFSIIDYTGKLGEGTSYLESYRTVNGTEYLIERKRIIDAFNTVSLILETGVTYHIKVLWADSTSYDWGYWPAGLDTTPMIVLYKLTFSQKAQLTYKYLSVEATRQNATWIRVNYQDNSPSPEETNWFNITVTYRNGTKVTSYNSTSETVSWNWYAADNETDYWVLADINHTFFNELEYSKLLDASLSYDSFIDLGVLGTLGGLNTANTMSAIIVLCVFGVGSRRNVDVALIAGFSVAGVLRIIGANTWSYNLLALGFALSIAYSVYRGRVRP